MPAVDLRGDVGDADAVQQERALPLHVLHRVGRERLELDREPGLRLGHRRGDRLVVLRDALGQDGAVLGEQLGAVEPDDGALLQPGEHLAADVVQQRDPGAEQDLGTEVRVPAGDAGRGVDDGGDLAADQRVGAHAVDVDVVDDGDVAGAQSLGQVLRAAVQPGGAGHSGPRLLGPAAPKGADAHDPHGFTPRGTPGPPTRNSDLSVTERVRHYGAQRHARTAPSGGRAGSLSDRD